MKTNARISVVLFLAFLMFGCKEKGHTPTTPSIDCLVMDGPNKGKKGKRTEDGWCKGDWGETECKPPSKCKTIPTEGTADTMERDTVDPNEGVDPQGRNAIVGIIPPVGSAAVEYCHRDDSTLSVFFRNTGELASSDQTTEVHVNFTTGSSTVTQTQLMPSIAPGETIEMFFEIPVGCFGPDCNFTIQWSNQPEVQGRCIG